MLDRMMRWWVYLGLAACASPVEAPAPQPAATPRSQAHASVEAIDRALDQLAAEIVGKLSESKKTKLAANEFLTLKGDANDLGKFVSEELTTRLIRSGKAQVVERRLLQKVLAEQEIGASQLVDDETAARIGKLLGADTLCVGTMTDLGPEIKINARLISAETAEVIGAASADLPKTRGVLALLGNDGGAGTRPAIVSGQSPVQERRAARAASRGSGSAITFGEAPQPAAEPKPAPVVTPVPSRAHPQPAATDVAVMSGELVIYVKRLPGGETPDTVQLRNKSGYCLKLWFNGKLARVYENTVEVPCVPDGFKSFLRIGAFGAYHVQASGSPGPAPFRGIVAYDRKHTFSPGERPVIVLHVADFYAVR